MGSVESSTPQERAPGTGRRAGRRGTQESGRGQSGRGRVADEARIERSALAHLERYSSSVENLRRLLAVRVARWREKAGAEPDRGDDDARAAIERVIERLVRYGLLDDRAFARARLRRLRARGRSARAIAAHLRARGVPSEIVRDLLATGTPGREEFTAACRYARRRRLGAYREGATPRTRQREKDLAALGRAGFDLATALRVIDAESREALEAQLDENH